MSLILSYFLPPVGVFLTKGIGVEVFINILLTLLFYIPGVLHAVWVIATDED
ncbi:MAG: YqaE/Pmp3 family membrane protein [Myxococcota bacterium]